MPLPSYLLLYRVRPGKTAPGCADLGGEMSGRAARFVRLFGERGNFVLSRLSREVFPKKKQAGVSAPACGSVLHRCFAFYIRNQILYSNIFGRVDILACKLKIKCAL